MKFLEKYVQWLRWGSVPPSCFLMAWNYSGTSTSARHAAEVTIDNVVLPAGQIDQTIVDQGIVPLETAMAEEKASRIESVDPAAMTITMPSRRRARPS